MAGSQQLSINLGLPATPDVKDPTIFVELLRVYNAINAVARGLDTYTGALPALPEDYDYLGLSNLRDQNISRMYPIFDVDVLAGAMINVYNVAGVLHARLANATDGTKPARGFAAATVTSGNRGEIVLLGLHPLLSGLTPGALYYLSAVSATGQITSAAPATVGNLVQPVGFALSDTAIWFNPTLLGTIV